jgi:hypothetical protein
MLPIEFGYGLMIAGALLVVAGAVGLAFRRNKEDEADPVALPGDAPWRDLPKKNSKRFSAEGEGQ